MRKLIRAVVLLVLAAFLSGMVQDDLDATHAKLRELQDYVARINNDLNNLDKIVNVLDESHSILSASPTDNGYSVSFNDGSTFFLPFGEDGKDGRTLIPVGVRNDDDGHYYWTAFFP